MPGARLDQEPGRQRLRQRVLAAQAGHRRQLGRGAGDGGDLERLARRAGEHVGAQQHGVEDRLGQRQAAGVAASPGGPASRPSPRCRTGSPACARAARRRRAPRAPPRPPPPPAGPCRLRSSRREGHLDRLADPAQLRAQDPEPVGVVGHLVARDHHEQQRELAQGSRELREQQLHRLARPVQVVQHDRNRAGRRDRRDRAPQRLDQRADGDVRRGRTELRQQGSEVGLERPARRGQPRGAAHGGAQDLGDRLVRGRDRRRRRAGVRRRAGPGERLGDEPGLADARLAGDEHAPRPARRNGGGGGVEGRQLGGATDHRAFCHDTESREREWPLRYG